MINGGHLFRSPSHDGSINNNIDNNKLCRTQDSNTHDRTKDKTRVDRLFRAVAINIFNKFRIITDTRIFQFVTNIRKIVPSDIFYIIR